METNLGGGDGCNFSQTAVRPSTQDDLYPKPPALYIPPVNRLSMRSLKNYNTTNEKCRYAEVSRELTDLVAGPLNIKYPLCGPKN